MTCEFVDTCTLIRHMDKVVPFTLNMVRIRYCESNKYECARYGLAQVLDMEQLPFDLWPSDETRALEMLELGIRREGRQVGYCSG